MQKKEWQSKIESKINEWGKELEDHESRTDSLSDNNRPQHDQSIKELEEKILNAKEKLTEVENVHDSQWDTFVTTRAWDSIIKG